MKAYFKAETPGEVYRHAHCQDAWHALNALWNEPQTGLRAIKKYRKFKTKEARDLIEGICEMYHETLQEYGIDLDEAGKE